MGSLRKNQKAKKGMGFFGGGCEIRDQAWIMKYLGSATKRKKKKKNLFENSNIRVCMAHGYLSLNQRLALYVCRFVWSRGDLVDGERIFKGEKTGLMRGKRVCR